MPYFPLLIYTGLSLYIPRCPFSACSVSLASTWSSVYSPRRNLFISIFFLTGLNTTFGAYAFVFFVAAAALVIAPAALVIAPAAPADVISHLITGPYFPII